MPQKGAAAPPEPGPSAGSVCGRRGRARAGASAEQPRSPWRETRGHTGGGGEPTEAVTPPKRSALHSSHPRYSQGHILSKRLGRGEGEKGVATGRYGLRNYKILINPNRLFTDQKDELWLGNSLCSEDQQANAVKPSRSRGRLGWGRGPPRPARHCLGLTCVPEAPARRYPGLPPLLTPTPTPTPVSSQPSIFREG